MSLAHNFGSRIKFRTFYKYAANRIERIYFFRRRSFPRLVKKIDYGTIKMSLN